MEKYHRITLLVISLIIFFIETYGNDLYMEIMGRLFSYAITFSFVYIALRGE